MGKSQPIEIAGKYFTKKSDALNYLKNMLNRYSPEEKVSKTDAYFLTHALKMHPEANEKMGAGVNGFIVRRADYGTKCFWVERIDDTVEKFSYKHCVTAPK